jgi:hypothetical protein
VAHAGGRSGVDRGAVLTDAVSDGVGADQQHPLAAREGRAQRVRRVEVAVADVGAAQAPLVQRVGTTRDEDQVRGSDTLRQTLGDEAAQVARRSCDDDAHGLVPTEATGRCGVPARTEAGP